MQLSLADRAIDMPESRRGVGILRTRLTKVTFKLDVAKSLVGTFDGDGKSCHHFSGVKDRIVVPELKGATPEAW